MSQKETSEWIERHWGNQTNEERLKKFIEEVAELSVACNLMKPGDLTAHFNNIVKRETTKISDPKEEFGDTLITMEHLATRMGVDLEKARDDKMKATQERKGKY